MSYTAVRKNHVTYTYRQPEKSEVRYRALLHAVKTLTSYRGSAACVRGSYVADLKQYFVSADPDDPCAKEAGRITAQGLSEWSRLWEACLGSKRAEDLVVCYLAGPEPTNDLEVLVSLGILPSNIWAFEANQNCYTSAVGDLDKAPWDSPRLVKMKAESFFSSAPITFDIVYLDSCSTLVSRANAFRLVSDLFRYQRLRSPGILITNFCEPGLSDDSTKQSYIDLIAQKSLVTSFTAGVVSDRFDNDCVSERLGSFRSEVANDFDGGYSSLITDMVSAAATTVVPAMRAANTGIRDLYEGAGCSRGRTICQGDSSTECRKGSTLRFLSADEWLPVSERDYAKELRKRLVGELGGAVPSSVKPLESLEYVQSIRANGILPNGVSADVLAPLLNGFEFLDSIKANLAVDLAFAQLARPMFPSLHSTKRFVYRAKTKKMYTDVIPFDECRYIFDWIPFSPHMEKAFSDISRQYIFRFALDGLVKQRLSYSTDYFFSGSVISDSIPGFSRMRFPEREEVR